MTPEMESVFARAALTALERQHRLATLIGDRRWGFNLAAGVLRFGDDLEFAAQVLGTESEHTRTWLWGWANEASGIPPEHLEKGLAVREIGAGQRIAELVEPELDLPLLSGHALAMVASVLTGSSAYYRGPYDGGAVYLLLDDRRIDAVEPWRYLDFQRSLMDLVVAGVGSQKELVGHYARARGGPVAEDPSSLTLRLEGGDEVRVRYDAEGRVERVEGRVAP